MSRKPDTKLLRDVWDNSKEFITKSDVELENVRLDELVANVFCNGPFYYYVIDFSDMTIKYMSPSVRDIHGLDPEATTFQDILDCIHPDDMPFVVKAEAMSWDILFRQIGMPRYKKYKTSYCLRFRVADGSFQLFNHQAIVLTTDENDRVAKALNIHTNISHLTEQNNYTLSEIGMFGEPSIINVGVLGNNALPQPTQALFTRRETEIIHLLSEGFTSQQIADRLHLSVDTVKTHRKNILAKAGCKNTGQLIAKCITHGYL